MSCLADMLDSNQGPGHPTKARAKDLDREKTPENLPKNGDALRIQVCPTKKGITPTILLCG